MSRKTDRYDHNSKFMESLIEKPKIAHPDIDSMANNDCQEINDILIETEDKETEQDISLNLMKDHANRNLWYVENRCLI